MMEETNKEACGSLQTNGPQLSALLTFGQHANSAALPQPAVLALPAHVHVHLTGPATLAAVHRLLGHTAPEEAYTQTPGGHPPKG